jgi:hypothetical protein
MNKDFRKTPTLNRRVISSSSFLSPQKKEYRDNLRRLFTARATTERPASYYNTTHKDMSGKNRRGNEEKDVI